MDGRDCVNAGHAGKRNRLFASLCHIQIYGTRCQFCSRFVALTFTEVAVRAVGFIPGGRGITEASLMGFFAALDVRPEFRAAAIVVERSLFYGINIGMGIHFPCCLTLAPRIPPFQYGGRIYAHGLQTKITDSRGR